MKSHAKKTVPKHSKAMEIFLPKPLELAKLAAILRPNDTPANAMKAAMEFYVEAVLFSGEQSSKPVETILTEFGSPERDMAQRAAVLGEALDQLRADTLIFDPRIDQYDPAREFLYEHGLNLKTARGFLKNFRRYWNSPLPKDTFRAYDRPDAQTVLSECKQDEIYELPKSLLEGMFCHALKRRKESRIQGADTKRKRRAGSQKKSSTRSSRPRA